VIQSRRALVLHGLLASLAGCAQGSGRVVVPRRDAGPGSEILFRQRSRFGTGWARLTVKLPLVSGPDSHLRIEAGRIVGQHRGQGLRLRTSADEISGWGTGGPVEMQVSGTDGDLMVDGLWNGERGLLAADSVGMRVLAAGRRTGTEGGRGPAGFHSYKFERRGEGFYAGDPRSETSQETTLELQSGVVAALKREQISALLLLLLSRPPVAAS
jgi:hypothetical protein